MSYIKISEYNEEIHSDLPTCSCIEKGETEPVKVHSEVDDWDDDEEVLCQECSDYKLEELNSGESDCSDCGGEFESWNLSVIKSGDGDVDFICQKCLVERHNKGEEVSFETNVYPN